MKTETLQFKVTEEERKLIEKCAKQEETTVSKYVRVNVLMCMVFEGNVEAIKIIAKDVGEKALTAVRAKLLHGRPEARTSD